MCVCPEAAPAWQDQQLFPGSAGTKRHVKNQKFHPKNGQCCSGRAWRVSAAEAKQRQQKGKSWAFNQWWGSTEQLGLLNSAPPALLLLQAHPRSHSRGNWCVPANSTAGNSGTQRVGSPLRMRGQGSLPLCSQVSGVAGEGAAARKFSLHSLMAQWSHKMSALKLWILTWNGVVFCTT